MHPGEAGPPPGSGGGRTGRFISIIPAASRRFRRMGALPACRGRRTLTAQKQFDAFLSKPLGTGTSAVTVLRGRPRRRRTAQERFCYAGSIKNAAGAVTTGGATWPKGHKEGAGAPGAVNTGRAALQEDLSLYTAVNGGKRRVEKNNGRAGMLQHRRGRFSASKDFRTCLRSEGGRDNASFVGLLTHTVRGRCPAAGRRLLGEPCTDGWRNAPWVRLSVLTAAVPSGICTRVPLSSPKRATKEACTFLAFQYTGPGEVCQESKGASVRGFTGSQRKAESSTMYSLWIWQRKALTPQSTQRRVRVLRRSLSFSMAGKRSSSVPHLKGQGAGRALPRTRCPC